MPDDPTPSAALPPPPPPSPPIAVDGVSAPAAAAPLLPPENLIRARKRGILALLALFYIGFALWCGFLLTALPSPTGEGASLVSAGLLSSLVGVLVLLGIGLVALKRISSAPASVATRRRSLLKVIGVLLPGVLLGAATPVFILREPSLPLDMVQPASAADLVAPVAVTLSAERASVILRNLGFRVLKYQWDADGDGMMNEETVTPTTTVVLERQGMYLPVVRMQLEGGGMRRAARRISVPTAVFSVTPVQPVVEKAVKFSVAGLLSDPKLLKQVQWDFGVGDPPVTLTTPDTVYTYFAVGDYPVTAIVQLQNNSQATYKRTVAVREPSPLPFPITLTTEPATLIGPMPFGVLFRLTTETPLKDVAWSFGDGKEDRGAALLRQSHIFESAGITPVVVRARSEDGQLAELTAIVRTTEVLVLRDLQFEGQPAVANGKITGEAPLAIRLTPKTSTPLVQFSWEVPEEIEAQATGNTLLGVFRHEGKYTVTLMAQGAEGKSMRMPISIDVKPPAAEPVIVLTPDGGTAPLPVTFDASQTFIPPGETVAGFKWLFGDEGQGMRTPELGAARVQHTFAKPGEYVIKLSVVLASGKEVSVQRTLVVRKPTLSACLTASRLSVQAGKGIEFDSGCSTGEPTSLLWDVRRTSDPDTVQAQSGDATYVYVFEEPGEYTVTLFLKDEYKNQDKKSVTITVTPAADAEGEPLPEEPSP